MGEVPDWWTHIQAAKYLGVTPWELSAQPVFWRNAALTALDVEGTYRKQQEARNNNSGR